MTGAAPGTIVIGDGPAGRAAAALLPEARWVAQPGETAWHAEPGLLWVEDAERVFALPFRALLLCADEPLLLATLGCAFAGLRPVVDGRGETTVPGVFAAGAVLGAATAEEAARQGRIAARAIAGLPAEDAIAPTFPGLAAPDAARLDPLDLAILLGGPPGEHRNRAALAQAAARGARLSGAVAPARPVSLEKLAALAPGTLPERGAQGDSGRLG